MYKIYIEGSEYVYLTIKQQLKHLSKEEYIELRTLCRFAKNLTNEAIYNVRQHYIKEKKYLKYCKNYFLLKNSTNYKLLNSNMAQQIIKEVDGSFKSFFELIKLSKEGKYRKSKIKLPYYLPKDGFATLVIGFIRIDKNNLLIPFSNKFKKKHKQINITIPTILENKRIKEIRIIPKFNARFFEIQYTYELDYNQRELNKNNALALDLGVNNIVSCVSNKGESFIVDGKRLKSINQWFNKENSRLQSIKDKQGYNKNPSFRQLRLSKNRENKINDYMSKTAKIIIDYCIKKDIGILVFGYDNLFQQKSNIGKSNNQNFVNIPFGKLKNKLKYLCDLNNIRFVEQEESYTSKASFWDKDDIPVFDINNNKKYNFSGRRIKRGLYKTKTGKLLNADINGALNILKKSNVVSLSALYDRGEVDTPSRIRVI